MQTLDEAPADVTIITRAQIRTYGYRTLGEALASVRGIYMTTDHIYTYLGASGFSLPGDFNTRVLVMINGHAMTENIYASNSFFGQDFGLDMDLVERIEVVRGPSSALYGSNGILATINVVTTSPVDFSHSYATAETGSFGEKKMALAGSYYLGKGANLLISASLVNDGGQNYYFPKLGASAIGMDGQRAYHTFANLVWKNWNIVAMVSDRIKMVPLAWSYDANSFASRGNHAEDGRAYLSANYARSIGPGELRFEFAYDQYRYNDRFDLTTGDPLISQGSHAVGDWIDSKMVYQVGAGVFGSLTAGLQGNFDLRAIEYDAEVYPQQIRTLTINRPSRGVALFVEDEKRLSSHWKLDFGGRLDESRYYGGFLSPRAALSYQPSAKTVYKFIYGRPFRNPSQYEQFYYDNIDSLKPGPLKPESANTYELVADHHFSPRLSGTVHLYDYRLTNLIQALYAPDGASTFANTLGAQSRGVEFEARAKPLVWLETDSSFAWQWAAPLGSSTVFANSPAFLAKWRWAVPAGKRLTISNSWDWMSSRLTFDGTSVRPVLMADLTMTIHRALPGFDVQVGMRNALNWSYSDPVGLSLNTFKGDPRSIFVKLIWNPGK